MPRGSGQNRRSKTIFLLIFLCVPAGGGSNWTAAMFGCDWRQICAVLYSDSTLIWCKYPGNPQPLGWLKLKKAPELISLGPGPMWPLPAVPEGCRYDYIFSIAGTGKIHHFLAASLQEFL
jgi:hypothetical protein